MTDILDSARADMAQRAQRAADHELLLRAFMRQVCSVYGWGERLRIGHKTYNLTPGNEGIIPTLSDDIRRALRAALGEAE